MKITTYSSNLEKSNYDSLGYSDTNSKIRTTRDVYNLYFDHEVMKAWDQKDSSRFLFTSVSEKKNMTFILIDRRYKNYSFVALSTLSIPQVEQRRQYCLKLMKKLNIIK